MYFNIVSIYISAIYDHNLLVKTSSHWAYQGNDSSPASTEKQEVNNRKTIDTPSTYVVLYCYPFGYEICPRTLPIYTIRNIFEQFSDLIPLNIGSILNIVGFRSADFIWQHNPLTRHFSVINPFPLDKRLDSADDSLTYIFLSESFRLLNPISLKFALKSPITSPNTIALVQIMALCRTRDRPSSDPIRTNFTYSNMGDNELK